MGETYTIVCSSDELEKVLDKLELAPAIACDTETVGNESYRLFCKAESIQKSFKVHSDSKWRAIVDICNQFYPYPTLEEAVKTVYKRQYKGRDARVSEYLHTLEAKERRKETLYKKTLKAAQTHPDGLDFLNNKLGCLQLGDEENIYLIKPQVISPALAQRIERMLNSVPVLLGQNFLFDWKMLKHHLGITLHCRNLFDTKLGAYVAENGKGEKYSLKHLALRWLNIELDKDISVRVSNWLGGWSHDQCEYAAMDVRVLFPLWKAIECRLAVFLLEDVLRLECNLVPQVAKMEMAGIGIDLDYLQKLNRVYGKLTERKERKFEHLVFDGSIDFDPNFNINSNIQLLEVLKQCHINVANTQEKTLNKHIKNPIVQSLLDYRSANKVLTTYVEPFKERAKEVNGQARIFGSFNQAGTESGRFSSSDPNLQNAPASSTFRRVFIPAPGHVFVDGDLSGIEMRILAEITEDPNLIRAFEQGIDIHKMAASLVFGVAIEDVSKEQRNQAKTVQYGIVYGQTSFGLAKGLGVTKPQADGLIKRYFMNFRRVEEFINDTTIFANEHGYVRTLGGRIRYLPDLDEDENAARIKVILMEKKGYDEIRATIAAQDMARKAKAHAERAAVNTIIQGTSADGMKEGMLILAEYLIGTDIRMILTVHDELLLECSPEDARMASTYLKTALIRGNEKFIKKVPVLVGSEENGFQPVIGANWGECK